MDVEADLLAEALEVVPEWALQEEENAEREHREQKPDIARTVHGAPVPRLTGDEANYDKTQLSIPSAIRYGRVHRDYLAHAIRFEWITQRLRFMKGQAFVLDVGCADVPLLRALDSGMNRPRYYLGIDVRQQTIDKARSYFKSKSTLKFDCLCLDFTEAPDLLIQMPWTHVICFEVLEHMPRARGLMLLDKLAEAVHPHGKLYLSTPCFDGQRQAGHHRYEWAHDELGEALRERFTIEENYGTFANVRALERVLTPAEREVWDNLSSYYGNVARSVIFAPLHPEVARNSAWVCSAK